MTALTRLASALVAAVLSVFIAAPAFAAGDPGEKFNPADQFSAAGEPINVVAILIVGAVLLVFILGLAQIISNLFASKDA